MLNLIREPWIPVRRRSGAEERIAPWQLTEGLAEDPIVATSSPRADFDGALVQFWIGLAQTCLAPQNPREWRNGFDEPPGPRSLREFFEPIAAYFDLLGDGPRFLQDLMLTLDEGEERSVEKLLIDHGLQLGKDHFVKGGAIDRLCWPCAAASLLALQTNGPGGGRGHRTGLRGGGPLTTLVRHEGSLWATVWLNVLTQVRFEGLGGNPARAEPFDRFPWLAPTRTSEPETGRDTTGDDVHPLQMYWAMPRRIRLLAAETGSGICDLCAQSTDVGIDRFLIRNHGINYSGPWLHPLSPHWKNKDGLLLPRHGRSSELAYSDWLGLVQEDETTKTYPARVVVEAAQQPDRASRQDGLRLWAFGYELYSMKARAWCEGTFPLILTEPDKREEWESRLRQIVLAARETANALSMAVRKALARRVKGMKKSPPEVEAQFLQTTREAFFGLLANLLGTVEAGEDSTALRQEWRATLSRTALRIFDTHSQVGQFRAIEPGRVARARNDLGRFLRGKKLGTRLDLPEPAKSGNET